MHARILVRCRAADTRSKDSGRACDWRCATVTRAALRSMHASLRPPMPSTCAQGGKRGQGRSPPLSQKANMVSSCRVIMPNQEPERSLRSSAATLVRWSPARPESLSSSGPGSGMSASRHQRQPQRPASLPEQAPCMHPGVKLVQKNGGNEPVPQASTASSLNDGTPAAARRCR